MSLSVPARSADRRLAGLRVALVFPTFLDVELASYRDNARFLGLIPPLNLAYVAGVLRAAGAEVLLLDCPALGLRIPEAIERLRRFGPDYLGFTLTAVDWLSSLSWIRSLGAALGAPVLVGGIHLECYPLETLSHPEISLGLAGHADLALVELLEAHQEGRDLGAVPGAVYRDGEGRPRAVPPRPRPRTAAGMPLPARELLPVERHFSIVSTESNFTAMMSNFGCPFGCEFCILRGDPLRRRSALAVVDEMELCYREHGVREIDFFDPVFTLPAKRVYAICDELERRGLQRVLTWSIRARTDIVDEGLLDRMWRAGCRRIFYGIESGSPEVLRRVNKRMSSPEDIARVVRATAARGYEVLAFVMIGNPLETRATVRATRRMLLELPIDLVQVASLFPLPKTPIYQEIVARTGVDPWREHTLHGTPVRPMTRLETALDEEAIERLVAETYARFYLRPRFVRFALGRVRDPRQLRRGLAAAAGITRSYIGACSGTRRG